jgi:NAD(P)H-flavin reductase
MSISSVESISDGVKKVLITPATDFHCKPGQHICFVSGDEISHKHHIANIPHRDHFIEIQFDILNENEEYNHWIKSAMDDDGQVDVDGPHGNFYYTTRYGLDYPLVLIGKGLGLAPLTAITKYALAAGHYGNIYLFHYCLTEFDLHYIDELEKVTELYKNFTYVPCVQEEGLDPRLHPEPIESSIKRCVPNAEEARFFICGDQDFNASMYEKSLNCGAKNNLIAMDSL